MSSFCSLLQTNIISSQLRKSFVYLSQSPILRAPQLEDFDTLSLRDIESYDHCKYLSLSDSMANQDPAESEAAAAAPTFALAPGLHGNAFIDYGTTAGRKLYKAATKSLYASGETQFLHQRHHPLRSLRLGAHLQCPNGPSAARRRHQVDLDGVCAAPHEDGQ